jgi:histidinol-phosphate/aromatic aminotransferase/cobyric acid decarboxylase-like protein
LTPGSRTLIAAAIPFFSEFSQAQRAERQMARAAYGGRTRQAYDPNAVVITPNENPRGPCKEGIEAMARVGPLGWRYRPQGENLEFEALLHSTEMIKVPLRKDHSHDVEAMIKADHKAG